jgi:hypothetical protein
MEGPWTGRSVWSWFRRSTAGNSMFYIDRDRATGIVKRLSHLLSDGLSCCLGHGG